MAAGHWGNAEELSCALELARRPPGRRGAPGSRRATEQALGAQVLIHVGPVDSESSAGQAPVGPLRESCGKKARIPHERHGDGATVQEIDNQGVLGKPDILDAFTRRWPL
jgi:hypothetical protein